MHPERDVVAALDERKASQDELRPVLALGEGDRADPPPAVRPEHERVVLVVQSERDDRVLDRRGGLQIHLDHEFVARREDLRAGPVGPEDLRGDDLDLLVPSSQPYATDWRLMSRRKSRPTWPGS